MTKSFMAHPDFLEGVSAAVIERRKPTFAALSSEEWTPIIGSDVDMVDWEQRIKDNFSYDVVKNKKKESIQKTLAKEKKAAAAAAAAAAKEAKEAKEADASAE